MIRGTRTVIAIGGSAAAIALIVGCGNDSKSNQDTSTTETTTREYTAP